MTWGLGNTHSGKVRANLVLGSFCPRVQLKRKRQSSEVEVEELLSRVVYCRNEKEMARLKLQTQTSLAGSNDWQHFPVSHFWTDLLGWKQGGGAFLHTQVPIPIYYRNWASGGCGGGGPTCQIYHYGLPENQKNQMDLAYHQDGLHRKTGQSAQWWELWPES